MSVSDPSAKAPMPEASDETKPEEIPSKSKDPKRLVLQPAFKAPAMPSAEEPKRLSEDSQVLKLFKVPMPPTIKERQVEVIEPMQVQTAKEPTT